MATTRVARGHPGPAKSVQAGPDSGPLRAHVFWTGRAESDTVIRGALTPTSRGVETDRLAVPSWRSGRIRKDLQNDQPVKECLQTLFRNLRKLILAATVPGQPHVRHSHEKSSRPRIASKS